MELLKKWIFRGEVLLPDSAYNIRDNRVDDECVLSEVR